ncbi:MAG: nitroreductase family protein [Parasulfuritortus sp.]|nr:nitroreductase family protein [Parasulfuritortus sp.]
MDAVATVLAYHERTKHRLDQYATGPGSLDWDAQPDPFRRWAGATEIPLPRDSAIPEPGNEVVPTLETLSILLRHAVAITAWKQYGPSRWSLRAHPSSGNLHPTETYVLSRGIAGLGDGLYHYQARDHSLELRASSPLLPDEGASLHLAFTSIPWREAWKYGERAFRYCQLDMGHVLAAVACSAALLGWSPRLLALDSDTLDGYLGLDRIDDFAGVEQEEAEVMLTLFGNAEPPAFTEWHGRPSLLDARPMYQWPIIEEIAEATRGALPSPSDETRTAAPRTQRVSPEILLRRRSAQAFDGHSVMPGPVFRQLLAALLPGGSPAASLWPLAARVHPVLFVHRVAEVVPGLYILPRSESGLIALGEAMRREFAWTPADVDLPLYQLVAARTERTARTVSCHQDIASQCAVGFMFVAEFAAPVAEAPAAWRHLHWEAGMLGHALTLAAEAEGWRGTGIGCFFDDADHEILGLKDDRFQVIYHFAVGMPVDDARLTTLPAYD